MGKKQHFVPKMILKRFSNDNNEKTISIHLLKKGFEIPSAPIRSQAYGDYLYGEDEVIESFLSKIENVNNMILDRLVRKDTNFSKQDFVELCLFISYQHLRTMFAATWANEMVDLSMKEIVRGHKSIGDKIDHFKIELTEPFRMLIDIASKAAVYFTDLRFSIVENNTDIPFLIGENPVIVFNPYLVQKRWSGAKNGIGSKGVIVYIPISPKIAIVLFDSLRYQIKRMNKIISAGQKDVHIFNEAQVATSEECVYFQETSSQIPFSKYSENTRKYREADIVKQDVYTSISEDGKKKGTLLVSGRVDLPVEQDFSFLKIRYDAFVNPVSRTLDNSREAIQVLREYEKDKDLLV